MFKKIHNPVKEICDNLRVHGVYYVLTVNNIEKDMYINNNELRIKNTTIRVLMNLLYSIATEYLMMWCTMP